MMLSVAGSAPARSSTARSLALWTVKLPLICAWPPRIASRMFGADSTFSSRTMAKGRPTFCWVTEPKRWAPWVSKRMLTTGSLLWLSKPAWASVRFSPDTMIWRCTRTGAGVGSLV